MTLQRDAGGDGNIGRRLYPLLVEAGFDGVRVAPLMVYVDATRPDLVDGFTRKTFTAMVEGVRETAIEAGLIEPDRFDAGIRALYRTTEADGVFCYSFFKGVGTKLPRTGRVARIAGRRLGIRGGVEGNPGGLDVGVGQGVVECPVLCRLGLGLCFLLFRLTVLRIGHRGPPWCEPSECRSPPAGVDKQRSGAPQADVVDLGLQAGGEGDEDVDADRGAAVGRRRDHRDLLPGAGGGGDDGRELTSVEPRYSRSLSVTVRPAGAFTHADAV